MHSFDHDGVTFFHNNTMHPHTVHIQTEHTRIEVPLTSLLAFVAQVVRRERIDRLEQAATLDVLFGTVDASTTLDEVSLATERLRDDVRGVERDMRALQRRAGL
jgi:hypothetical protein